jgi:hypothetical protein
MRRLSQSALDVIGLRLAELDEEKERLQDQLRAQIQEFGSTPPKAEKSKRIQTLQFQFTLSSSSTTEVFDAEVERIKAVCPETLFEKLFIAVTKYKLARTAPMLLAGKLPPDAPLGLRRMFSRAVQVCEGSPRLRVERIDAEPAEKAC